MSWRARGLRPWVWQRLSALYLLLAVGYLLVTLPSLPVGYAHWLEWVGRPFHQVLFLGLILAVGVHAWVGGRDVILDYMRPVGLRLVSLAFLAFGLSALGLYLMVVVLGVGR